MWEFLAASYEPLRISANYTSLSAGFPLLEGALYDRAVALNNDNPCPFPLGQGHRMFKAPSVQTGCSSEG